MRKSYITCYIHVMVNCFCTTEMIKIIQFCFQGGLRHASASVGGPEAYRHMKFEGGVHRVQRVPKTEKQGRIHTSTMTVAILPQPTEVKPRNGAGTGLLAQRLCNLIIWSSFHILSYSWKFNSTNGILQQKVGMKMFLDCLDIHWIFFFCPWNGHCKSPLCVR